ncbi:MAG: 50S ribosomal protein L2 [Elusimicrobia bacterium]|nr:50S ribosomal protein L2 [Elusimicrobiota bacterium]
MAITRYKPLTPARRFSSRVKKDEITKKKPEKSLVIIKRKTGGRNNLGRITTRHRGGGSKQKIRIVDFKRERAEQAKVIAIEYDPNRSANIALIQYPDEIKSYILCPLGLKVGDTVQSAPDAPVNIGNVRPLKNMPEGTIIHNIELNPGQGGVLVRSAGAEATVTAKEDKYVQIKFPSGEVRLIQSNCRATIGKVGNIDHEKVNLGFAGATFHRGRRPKVRGTAMNAVDHPHGGGRGKSKGHNIPSTPWGKKCKGVKTRDKNKPSERMILRRKK